MNTLEFLERELKRAKININHAVNKKCDHEILGLQSKINALQEAIYCVKKVNGYIDVKENNK